MTKAGFGPRDAASGVSSIAIDPCDMRRLGFQLFNSVLGVVDTSTPEGEVVALYRPPPPNEGEEGGTSISSTYMGRLSFTPTDSYFCAAGGNLGNGQAVVVADMKAMGLRFMEKLSTADLLEKKYDKQLATAMAASVGMPFNKKDAMEEDEVNAEKRAQASKHVVTVAVEGMITSVACHPTQRCMVAGLHGNEVVIVGPRRRTLTTNEEEKEGMVE